MIYKGKKRLVLEEKINLEVSLLVENLQLKV